MKTLILTLTLLPYLLFAQTRIIPFSSNPGAGAAYTTEATRYFAAMSSQLVDSQKTNIDDLVISLQDTLSIDSLSQYFDCIYIFANETEESALMNLVKRSNDATNVDATTFTAWQGFTGDGTADYINTNYNATDDGVVYTLNDAHISLYRRVAGVDAGATSAMGVFETAAQYTSYTILSVTMYWQINGATDASSGAGGIINAGYLMTTRTASDEAFLYRNGTQEDNESPASVALNTIDTYVLAENLDDGTARRWKTDQASIVTFGKGMTETQAGYVNACIEAYLDGIGAGIQ